MDLKDLEGFKSWFSTYTRSFHSADTIDQKNISLKIDHTIRVCNIITRIADEQSLSRDQIAVAEIIALFHDIGRFPQYAKYKTFRDSISVNHGRLGAELLEKERLLEKLSGDEQGIIINAVKFHNAFAIPDLSSPDQTLFLKLVRDADKLDIWRIFTQSFEGDENEKASEVGQGLPDLPVYSAEVVNYINEEKTISFASIRTLNDFKLLQLSWVYDLNFTASIRLLKEGDYINRIASLLPQTEEIARIAKHLKEFADNRLKHAKIGLTSKP
jgi:putative nucleotidyltransferase with HDIG domain